VARHRCLREPLCALNPACGNYSVLEFFVRFGSPARPAGPRKPLEGPISHRNTLAECGRALGSGGKPVASQSPDITQPGLLGPLTYEGPTEWCGVTIRTLQRAAAAGELRVIRYGHRTVRVDPGDLLAWPISKKSGIRCNERHGGVAWSIDWIVTGITKGIRQILLVQLSRCHLSTLTRRNRLLWPHISRLWQNWQFRSTAF
jgi:hypothetical protein